ncbi:hypothetical protein K443DRAFT_682988 [Laccaria amethystina LaAM-08-1]|uniref:Uncharacterized protein n=1 Tax=Laccaria amethystina LaAM-08-1 TaxID=1095629 RepID=A0A0C9WTV6_9AGAR|nr:hypothetical protein K443DRAFT_682988 [Laccaria amethystina LaAM-08-1]
MWNVTRHVAGFRWYFGHDIGMVIKNIDAQVERRAFFKSTCDKRASPTQRGDENIIF